MSKFIEKYRGGFTNIELCDWILKSKPEEMEDILNFIAYLGVGDKKDKKSQDLINQINWCYAVKNRAIILDESFISAFQNSEIVSFFSKTPELIYVYDKVLLPYIKYAQILYNEAKKEWLEKTSGLLQSRILGIAIDALIKLENRDYRQAYFTASAITKTIIEIIEDEGSEINPYSSLIYIWSRFTEHLRDIYLFLDGASPPFIPERFHGTLF